MQTWILCTSSVWRTKAAFYMQMQTRYACTLLTRRPLLLGELVSHTAIVPNRHRHVLSCGHKMCCAHSMTSSSAHPLPAELAWLANCNEVACGQLPLDHTNSLPLSKAAATNSHVHSLLFYFIFLDNEND